LPSDAVLDALKMILLGASLNEVLTTVTRLIEAHSVGMLCSIFLLDDDSLHLRSDSFPFMGEKIRETGIANADQVLSSSVPRTVGHSFSKSTSF
jgi:hypothetical protein